MFSFNIRDKVSHSIQNCKQNYVFVYFNFYVFRQQTRRQRVLSWMVASTIRIYYDLKFLINRILILLNHIPLHYRQTVPRFCGYNMTNLLHSITVDYSLILLLSSLAFLVKIVGHILYYGSLHKEACVVCSNRGYVAIDSRLRIQWLRSWSLQNYLSWKSLSLKLYTLYAIKFSDKEKGKQGS
jgi:hypothetical protein